jgi:hypothetical protein
MCADSLRPAKRRSVKALCLHWSLVLCLGLSAWPARAHNDGLSEASVLSGLSVAASVSAPVMSIAAGGSLVLASIEVVADGTVWVLQRASDGARLVVKWSVISAGMASVAVGTVITVTAVSAGWVLSTAGEVLALIPNSLGQALLHHERVIR